MSDERLEDALSSIRKICEESQNISQFFPYGGDGYKSSVRHFLESSCDVADAAVQPGRLEDLVEIMKVLARTGVQFAVRGGGHATNPGFSSTKGGIQISMTRFNKISYDKSTTLLSVQAGCLFDEVYGAIKPHNRNIVGGSAVAGVGVAGWLLGGGYSLKTNQFGLGIDNLVGFQIVLPTGEWVDVKEGVDKDQELFEAVKGGGNNFGIVTEFILKTHPQGPVYGGILTYNATNVFQVEQVKNAIIDFIKTKQVPKTAIVAAFRHYNDPDGMKYVLTVQFFYDGPKPHPDPFREFLKYSSDSPVEMGGVKLGLEEMSYAKLDKRLSNLNEIQTLSKTPMAGVGENARGRWGNVMVSRYTRRLIDEIENQGKIAQMYMIAHGGKMVVTDMWPFLPTIFQNSPPAAWPHDSDKPNGPLLVYFLWEGEKNDTFWIEQMQNALKSIKDVALAERCTTPDAPVYSNTTLAQITSVQEIYRGNLSKLVATRKKYDSDNVMGQTGGFRIPLNEA